jgi:hypothetical protein
MIGTKFSSEVLVWQDLEEEPTTLMYQVLVLTPSLSASLNGNFSRALTAPGHLPMVLLLVSPSTSVGSLAREEQAASLMVSNKAIQA